MRKAQIKKLIPRLPDLKKAHKEIFTADLTDRIIALRKVLDWFDVYTTLVRSAVVANGGQRKLDLAAKIKPLAERHDTPPFEAQTALLQAIRMLEAALLTTTVAGNVPRIDAVWADFESKQAALEAKAIKATKKFEKLQATFDQFFAPLNLTFAFKKGLPKQRQFDATGRVMYSFEYAETLVTELKANGAASVLLGQAPAILKAASITVNAGQAAISVGKLLNLLPGLLTSVHDLGARGKVLIPTSPAPQATPTATATPNPTPSTPKPPKPPTPQPVGGLSARAAKYFRAGTQQILFDRLVKSTGTMTMADLYNGLQAGDPRRMVLSIHQKGVKLGLWEANREGNIVHFAWTGGPTV